MLARMRSNTVYLLAFFLAGAAPVGASAPWAGNPSLKRAFVAGYGVNSGVEPELSDEDKRVLDLIQPVIEQSREDAIRSLVKYVDDSTNARFDLILGNLYLEAQKLDLAIGSFGRAIKKFPDFRAAHKNLGVAYLQQQSAGNAIRHFTEAIRLGEGDGAMFGLLGQCYLSLGIAADAETAFRHASLLRPDSVEWKRGVIASLVRQGRIPDAISQVDAMLARDPDNPEYLSQQADLYAAAQNFSKAAEILELLALEGAAKPEQLFLLGDLYVNAKLPRLAVRAYARGMEVSEDVERVVKALEVMGGSGAIDEAGDLLEAVQAKAGENAPAAFKTRLLRAKAKFAAARNNQEESAEVLKQITETDPLDGEAWMMLGKHYRDKEENERALFAYERAAALEDFKADANVRLAEIHAANKEYAKAVMLLEEAQRIKPREAIARYLDQLKLIVRSKG